MTAPGFFVVLDGPSGVGKSTVAPLLANFLARAGYSSWATTQPSAGPIGALARTGTREYRGLALACLVAADRYHHLETAIRPALRAGRVVVCDRYVPSSLVLQRLDGVSSDYVWGINAHADRPDLTVIMTGDEQQCRTRAAYRGRYSRFHDGLTGEVAAYRRIKDELIYAGYPTFTVDVGKRSAEKVARELTDVVLSRLTAVTR